MSTIIGRAARPCSPDSDAESSISRGAVNHARPVSKQAWLRIPGAASGLLSPSSVAAARRRVSQPSRRSPRGLRPHARSWRHRRAVWAATPCRRRSGAWPPISPGSTCRVSTESRLPRSSSTNTVTSRTSVFVAAYVRISTRERSRRFGSGAMNPRGCRTRLRRARSSPSSSLSRCRSGSSAARRRGRVRGQLHCSFTSLNFSIR
jgi:hypothetical protein